METKAVKLTQALRACNSPSSMLSKGIYTHLPGRCRSGNLLCLLKPAISKRDYSSLPTVQRTGAQSDGAAGSHCRCNNALLPFCLVSAVLSSPRMVVSILLFCRLQRSPVPSQTPLTPLGQQENIPCLLRL